MTSINCPAEAEFFARGSAGKRRRPSESSAQRKARSELFDTDACDNRTGVDQPGKKITRVSTMGVAPLLMSLSASESPYQGSAMCRFVATKESPTKKPVPEIRARISGR